MQRKRKGKGGGGSEGYQASLPGDKAQNLLKPRQGRGWEYSIWKMLQSSKDTEAAGRWGHARKRLHGSLANFQTALVGERKKEGAEESRRTEERRRGDLLAPYACIK